MATVLDQLKTSRDQVAAQIVTLTAGYAPDVSLDGQGVQHGAQLDRLTRQLDELTKLIARYEPFRVVSVVR